MTKNAHTSSVLADFREVIYKSQPAELCDSLKQRLEQADKDAQQVKELTERLQKAHSIIESYETQALAWCTQCAKFGHAHGEDNARAFSELVAENRELRRHLS